MSETIQPSPQLEEARRGLVGAYDVAERTGVPEFSVSSDPNPTRGNLDVGVNAVWREKGGDYGFGGPYAEARTEDARVVQPDPNSWAAYTQEKTGEYSTDAIYKSPKNHEGRVWVNRPDGKGGEYYAVIKGRNGEKAAAIISRRATERVGKAAIKRAGSITSEYLKKVS